MEEQPPKRPSWLTLSVLGAAAAVGVYVFVIGSEIGTMRQQILSQELRITALETHGSGPVQTTAARVESMNARQERQLTELLAMQQRIADLQAAQQSQGVTLQHLQEDMAKQAKQ
jgi:hypothetical protein